MIVRLLAIDTATSAITAAVCDQSTTLAEVAVIDARRHTEALAPAVADVLQRSRIEARDLTHIAVGVGPGPFTGLRVGIVTAVTMGYALGIPVHGVCSLDALAQAYADAHPEPADVVVATDARRTEVYWARYAVSAGFAVRRSEPSVGRPAELPAEVRALPAIGRGAVLYPELLPNAALPLDVSAATLGAVAIRHLLAGDPILPTPLYLRRPDAHEPGTPKSALADGGTP